MEVRRQGETGEWRKSWGEGRRRCKDVKMEGGEEGIASIS